MPTDKRLANPNEIADWYVVSFQPGEGDVKHQSQNMMLQIVIYYGIKYTDLGFISHSLAWAGLGWRQVGDIYGIVVDLAGKSFINVPSLAGQRSKSKDLEEGANQSGFFQCFGLKKSYEWIRT